MPDTTTTRYSLIKPEIGASDDTWGTKINGNMDLIDAAIASVAETGTNANGRYSRFSNGFCVITKTASFVYDSTVRLVHTYTAPLANFTFDGAAVTLSSQGTDYLNCALIDLGVVSASPSGASVFISRANSGVSFPANAQVNNVRLVMFGRWS